MGQSSYILDYEEVSINGNTINQRFQNTHTFLNNVTSRRHKSFSTSSNSRTYVVQQYQNIRPDREKTGNKNKRKSRVFGDHLIEKENNLICIVSQNVNCIGVSDIISHKLENAKDWLYQHSVDIVGWHETGVAFHMVPRNKRLAQQMNDLR